MKRAGFADVFIIVIVLVALGIGFWWFKNNSTEDVVKGTSQGVTTRQEDSRFAELLDRKINKPQFETVEEASQYLADQDIIFVLTYKNETRAYPQRILNWHEVVADKIGGISVVVSFSPLSGASSASEKTNGGEMPLSLDAMLLGDFKTIFPNSKVLSRNTGFDIDYNTLPELPPVEDTTFVWGVELNGKFKAYSEEELKEKGYIKDGVGGVPIDIYYFKGDILIRNLKTKEEIVGTRMFQFAWQKLHPESDLY